LVITLEVLGNKSYKNGKKIPSEINENGAGGGLTIWDVRSGICDFGFRIAEFLADS
jgi:hypothetical protein